MLGHVPVAELRIADAQRNVELDGHPGRFLAIDPVSDKTLLVVINDGQVEPAPELVRGDRRWSVIVSAAALGALLYAQDDGAVVADLPVQPSRLPTVGHH